MILPPKTVAATTSDILCAICGGDWFGSHGEECADEQNGGADQLGLSEAFVENPSGERERAERAKELKRLGECDADFLDRNVIQNVRHGDAGDGGDDENEIYMCTGMKRGVDSAEEQSQRK